jgi:hypothetical protein
LPQGLHPPQIRVRSHHLRNEVQCAILAVNDVREKTSFLLTLPVGWLTISRRRGLV